MNEFHTDITKMMVFSYFANLATPLERQQIETWLKTKEGFEKYFTYLDEWERLHPQFTTNFDQAHQKFTDFVASSGQEAGSEEADHMVETPDLSAVPLHSAKRRGPYRKTLLVAASVMLLTSLWFSRDFWLYKTWESNSQRSLSILLEDGSKVQLGANSSLKKFRFGFGWATRRVWLKGEGEFQVVHLPDASKFIVNTPDNTEVEVLGTEFGINSRLKSTKVMLKSGSIRLFTPLAKQPLTLKPGDLLTIFPESKIEHRFTDDPLNETDWKFQQFEFKETPLHEVARQLYEMYGTEIVIPDPKILNRTVSGAFEAESADDLLDAIATMMRLKIEETPGAYRLVRSLD